MVARKGAGALNARVTFQKRGDILDEYGVPSPGLGPWQDQFSMSVRLMPYVSRRDAETVIAARLASTPLYYLTARSSVQSRSVTPAWRAIDARAGDNDAGQPKRAFDIKSVSNPDEQNAYLEMLLVEGTAS
ncbi:head-tail adaptor protein [Mesorhizobium australicum]|uniref:head-tail adaptor protein n=1 Tax=Mesorhizobium australicum TaxID=536018 RepID=UPI00333A8679